MIDSTAVRAWGRAWPSRSRTQGAAFSGAKGKPEDDEMRRQSTSSEDAGIVGSVI
jgi:hypothetical protein